MDALQAASGELSTLTAILGMAVLFGWESLHPFFDFYRSPSYSRTRHALRNLVLGALNLGLVVVVFVGLWLAAAVWAEAHGFGLLHVLTDSFEAPLWVHAAAAIVLQDLWMYAWHRLNHAVPFLWRFHRVHHADEQMDVTTATRFHIGEIAFGALLRVLLIVLLGLYFWEVALYEMLMFAVVQLHHANIVLPPAVDRVLRLLIVTPALHKVHHSAWRPETDSNYGTLFSFWDRIGRSLRERKDLSGIRFGLDEAERDEETLGRMLRLPFSRKDRP